MISKLKALINKKVNNEIELRSKNVWEVYQGNKLTLSFDVPKISNKYEFIFLPSAFLVDQDVIGNISSIVSSERKSVEIHFLKLVSQNSNKTSIDIGTRLGKLIVVKKNSIK